THPPRAVGLLFFCLPSASLFLQTHPPHPLLGLVTNASVSLKYRTKQSHNTLPLPKTRTRSQNWTPVAARTPREPTVPAEMDPTHPSRLARQELGDSTPVSEAIRFPP
ncbi:hypothetical protein BD779DRAFT_1536979, partial [Infundibulicybe gibba]